MDKKVEDIKCIDKSKNEFYRRINANNQQPKKQSKDQKQKYDQFQEEANKEIIDDKKNNTKKIKLTEQFKKEFVNTQYTREKINSTYEKDEKER